MLKAFRLQLFGLLATALASTPSSSSSCENGDEASLLSSHRLSTSQEALIQQIVERTKAELQSELLDKIAKLEEKNTQLGKRIAKLETSAYPSSRKKTPSSRGSLQKYYMEKAAIMKVVGAFKITKTSITVTKGRELIVANSNLRVFSDDPSAKGKGNLVVGLNHAYQAASNGFVAGAGNTIMGHAPSITGGKHNSASTLAVVGGGLGNSASETYTFVAAGFNNQATGNGSAIITGFNNTAAGLISFTAGGENNVAQGPGAVAIAGDNNELIGVGSVGITGSNNVATLDAAGAVVMGGTENTAMNVSVLLANGRRNMGIGLDAVMMGGESNKASGQGGITMAGAFNYATATGGTVIGGVFNNASGEGSTVISGSNLSSPGPGSVALAGSNNTAAGPGSVTAAGFGNIAAGPASMTAAGTNLIIPEDGEAEFDSGVSTRRRRI